MNKTLLSAVVVIDYQNVHVTAFESSIGMVSGMIPSHTLSFSRRPLSDSAMHASARGTRRPSCVR